MRRALLLVALFSALSVVPAAGAGEWTSASSAHFDIYTTTGERRARDTLAFFEKVQTFFSGFLNVSPPAGRPIRLIVFSNEREFRPYRINDAAVAYFRPGPDRDYIVMQSLGVEDDPIVVHEYVHLLLSRPGSRYPVWLSEGLAEYFSTLAMTGSLTTFGRAPDERLNELASGRMIALDRLFQVTRSSADYNSVQHAGMFYAESWALTHMLLTHDAYRASWQKFQSILLGGASPAAAFKAAYQKSIGDVMKDLDRYVRTERFTVRTVTFKPGVSAAPITTEPASTFEAALVEANLLAAAREDRQKATAAYDALARQQPNNIALLETRAAFEVRYNQLDAARALYGRAVKLGTRNPRTYRDYATLLTRVDPAGEVSLLQTAVALEPSNVDSRVRLAFSLFREGEPSNALDMVATITAPTPTDAFNLCQLRVNAYLALGEFDRARAAALELVGLASRQPRQTPRRLAATLFTTVETAISAHEERATKPADDVTDAPPPPNSGL